MIGLSTVIVKTGVQYEVHRTSATMDFCFAMQDFKKGKIKSLFADVWKDVKRWKKPNLVTSVEAEILQIANANHENEREKDIEPGYSEFAGDIVFFIDIDNKKFYKWVKEQRFWVENGG